MFISKNLRKYTAFFIASVGLLIFASCEGGTSALESKQEKQQEIPEEPETKDLKTFEDIAGPDFCMVSCCKGGREVLSLEGKEELWDRYYISRPDDRGSASRNTK